MPHVSVGAGLERLLMPKSRACLSQSHSQCSAHLEGGNRGYGKGKGAWHGPVVQKLTHLLFPHLEICQSGLLHGMAVPLLGLLPPPQHKAPADPLLSDFTTCTWSSGCQMVYSLGCQDKESELILRAIGSYNVF